MKVKFIKDFANKKKGEEKDIDERTAKKIIRRKIAVEVKEKAEVKK